MEAEKIKEIVMEEKTQEMVSTEESPRFVPTEKSPGFNWGQIVLVIGVVTALLFASWNAFSIMETDKEMNAEDSDLSSEIEAVDSSLSGSIGVLDDNMSAQIITLDGRISELQNRLTQEKDYLIDMLESLNSTLQGKIDTLQNNVSVLDGNIAQIDSDIDELDGNITQIDSDIDELDGDIKQIDNDINNMQADIQDLQDQLDALKGRVTVLEQACDFDEDGVLDKYDTDDDNDGFPDTSDAFPHNATEWNDNDNDGIGDNADPDDDNDGYLDDVDVLPYKDAKVKFTAISFTLDYLAAFNDVYFVVYIDWGKAISHVYWDCAMGGEECTVNWTYMVDIPDDIEIVNIEIYMLDENIDSSNAYLDIEGKSASYWLYLVYNIATGEWTGGDDDGYSSGSDDGRTGELDVMFYYNIETI